MISDAVHEVVELLQSFAGAPRADVEPALSALRSRNAPLAIHLVNEHDGYTQRREYGALVRAPGGETAYVTVRAPSATPWLLQQVHRWREGDLLRVDEYVLSVVDAVGALDGLFAQPRVQARLVDLCILRREITARGITVGDAEMQAAVDELRRAHGLLSVEATERWLRDRGIPYAELERHAQFHAQTKRLRGVVVGHLVAGYFAEHADAVWRATLLRVWFSDAERARAAIGEGELSAAGFLGLVSRVGASIESAVVTRAELSPLEVTALFDRPGVVVGPLDGERGAYVAYVAMIDRASQLDEPTSARIEKILFDAWMAERRAGATIEWNWGRDNDAT